MVWCFNYRNYYEGGLVAPVSLVGLLKQSAAACYLQGAFLFPDQ